MKDWDLPPKNFDSPLLKGRLALRELTSYRGPSPSDDDDKEEEESEEVEETESSMSSKEADDDIE